MNKNNVCNEILESIDNVDSVTCESCFDVIMSLGSAYDKAANILEYSTSDDLDAFSIFQEAEAAAGEPNTEASAQLKKDAPAAEPEKKKEDGVLYKIVHFIPRLLKAFWEFIKKVWNGNIVPAVENAVETVKNIPDNIRGNIDDAMEQEDQSEAGITAFLKSVGISAAVAASAATLVITLFKLNENFRQKFITLIGNLKNRFKTLRNKDINPVWKISLKNMNITTNLQLESISSIFNEEVINFIDSVSKFDSKSISIDLLNQKNQELSDLLEKITALEILSDEAKEYGFAMVGQMMVVTNKNMTEAKGKIEAAISNIDLLQLTNTNDAGQTKNHNEGVLGALKKLGGMLQQLLTPATVATNLTSNIGKEFDQYIDIAKQISDKMAAEEKAADENAAKAAGENAGDGTESTDQSGAQDTGDGAETGDDAQVNVDDIKVEESSVDEIPEGEEIVEESMSEEDIAINNHWYS